MKYKVISTLLTSPQKDFRAGDVVTATDLKSAGFNADFLIAGGALSPLEGTEDVGDSGLLPTDLLPTDLLPTDLLPTDLLPGGVQGTDPLPMKTDPSAPGNSGSPADLPLDDAALSQKLIGAGLDTPEKVKAATDDALRAIPGIGEASVAKIRAQMNA